MPIGYQFFAIKKFPSDNTFKTKSQLTLKWKSEHDREETCTQLQLRFDDVRGYKHYLVQHEYLFQLDQPGRAHGQVFREFVTPYKFSLYRGSPDDALGFAPLIIRTKKKVARDFVNTMNARADGFETKPIRLDFATLRPRLEVIRGAWFGVKGRPNIVAVGYFGDHVDRSDEFRRAEGIGELTSLQIEMQLDNLVHTVMFCSDGSLVLYNSYLTESDELGVIRSAIAELLYGCFTVR